MHTVGYRESIGLTSTRLHSTDRELSAFRDAVNQGVEPDGTTMQKVQDAMILSNERGAAYGRDFNVATPMGDI